MKINWSAVATTLTGLAILAFVGGVLDFQSIKAEVKSIKRSNVNRDKALKAMGIILCHYAIKDKMKNAEKVCKDVL